MYTIKVHKRIEQIISVFYFMGLWHDDRENNFRKWVFRIYHIVIYGYFPVSLIAEAFTSDNESEAIYLGVVSIVAFVLAVRLYYFLLKKDEILELVHKMCTHSVTDNEQFHKVSNKIRVFIKIITYFGIMVVCSVSIQTVIALPMFSNEKVLPYNIYFFLDWRKSQLAYWIAFVFVMYESMISIVCVLFNIIIWYLMVSCVTEYQILGSEFRNIGTKITLTENILSVVQKQELFLEELTSLIKRHQNLQVYTIFRNIYMQ